MEQTSGLKNVIRVGIGSKYEGDAPSYSSSLITFN